MSRPRVRRFIPILESLAAKELRGIFYRCVRADCATSAFATVWSATYGGRYNPLGLEALYLATTPVTALLEVEALLRDDAGGMHGTRFAPRLLLSADVVLQRTVSLQDPGILAELKVSENDLDRGSSNLVLFSDKLLTGSSVRLYVGDSESVPAFTIEGTTPP